MEVRAKNTLVGSASGSKGLSGSANVNEILKGDPGKSAYEYAKEAGYTGTEEEFATKLATGGSSVSEEEMLNFLMDTDIVQPLSDTNNSVYTDNNNKLYVL